MRRCAVDGIAVIAKTGGTRQSDFSTAGLLRPLQGLAMAIRNAIDVYNMDQRFLRAARAKCMKYFLQEASMAGTCSLPM